jgi:hypothetical protein
MAKDLPYFKFFVSEWNDGDITLEDYNIQGLFINVCSYYWSNECIVSNAKLYKKFKNNSKDIDYLIQECFIKVLEDSVSISFLDEQLSDRNATSNRNSLAGKASAEKRRLAKLEQQSNTNPTPVKIPLNGNPTIKRREEEIREEKKRVDNNKQTIFTSWLDYRKEIKKTVKIKSTLDKLIDTFNSAGLKKCEWVVNNSIENGYTGLFWDNYKEIKKTGGTSNMSY